jgi:hypothetical protein
MTPDPLDLDLWLESFTLGHLTRTFGWSKPGASISR